MTARESGPATAATRGIRARQLVRRFRDGALATQSLKFPGYPYVSALPFCTDQRGRIVVLISHLAEHTRNAEADGRAGFLVSPAGPQMQEQARVNQIGDIAPVDDPAVAARYLRFFPDAAQYLQIGGFRFFRIEPVSLRYIAGFGSIHTIAGESYLAPELPIASAEEDILAHMNQEHAHNLRDYCRHAHGVEVQAAEMAGIDCDGFDVRADGKVLRFEFGTPVADADQARAHLVRLARAGRA
jgi:putative heme iron utilization protein